MTPSDVISSLPLFVFVSFVMGLALRWILSMFGWLNRYF